MKHGKKFKKNQHLALKLTLTCFLLLLLLRYQNRQLALAGAHVVMAVRRTRVAQELIQKWQNENSEDGRPLNAEVILLMLVTWHWFMKRALTC
jgi:hypothetical protein